MVQLQKHKDKPADYMDLFRSTSAWPYAAKHLNIFKISTQMALRSTDEQLKSVIDGLKREGIAMGIELGILVGTDRCGFHVEGYGAPTAVETVCKRIQKFGGTLDYVAMDEPVWMGHVITGENRCHDAVEDLVDQIAPKIAILRQYFPNITIGDIEPINASPGAMRQSPKFVDEVILFSDLLEKKTGQKLAFVHADITWTTPWQPMLEQLAGKLRERGIRFGLICDGDANVGGDEAWVRQAVQRYRQVSSDPKTIPDDLIIQSWEPLPTKMLPETDPGSLTYEVKQIAGFFYH